MTMTTSNHRHPTGARQRLILTVAAFAILPMGTALAVETPDAVVSDLLPEDRAVVSRPGPTSPIYPGGDLTVSRPEAITDRVTEKISTHLTPRDRAGLTTGSATVQTDHSITTGTFLWGPWIV